MAPPPPPPSLPQSPIRNAPPIPAKKRSGATNIFRAVMLAFGGRSSKKSHVNNIIVDANTADTILKTLVGGMRPLHYSLDYQHPAPPPPPLNIVLDAYYDVHMPPSPCSSVGMSRYASAEDLQLLDTSEDNEEEGSNGEPNVIDMKAEEFIAMFYKQIRQQRLDSLKSAAKERATAEESEDPLMTIEEEKATAEEEGATPLRPIEEEKATAEEEGATPLRPIEEENADVEESVDSCKTIEEEKATVE